MTYTFQVFYPINGGKERAASVLHVEGETLAEVMAAAKREAAGIPGAKLGACVPGKHLAMR